MIVSSFRCLDRPLELFGLRGRWLSVFGITLVCLVLVSVVVGMCTSSAVGVVCAVLSALGSFFVCRSRQSRISCRQLPRMSVAGGMTFSVRRSSTLCCVVSRLRALK